MTNSGDLSSSTATRSSVPIPCSISQCANRFDFFVDLAVAVLAALVDDGDGIG